MVSVETWLFVIICTLAGISALAFLILLVYKITILVSWLAESHKEYITKISEGEENDL